jgi:hypothetical protein
LKSSSRGSFLPKPLEYSTLVFSSTPIFSSIHLMTNIHFISISSCIYIRAPSRICPPWHCLGYSTVLSPKIIFFSHGKCRSRPGLSFLESVFQKGKRLFARENANSQRRTVTAASRWHQTPSTYLPHCPPQILQPMRALQRVSLL